MAYIIAEPCIGTKDTACVEVCPWTAFTPRRTRTSSRGQAALHSIPRLASTAVRASRFAR